MSFRCIIHEGAGRPGLNLAFLTVSGSRQKLCLISLVEPQAKEGGSKENWSHWEPRKAFWIDPKLVWEQLKLKSSLCTSAAPFGTMLLILPWMYRVIPCILNSYAEMSPVIQDKHKIIRKNKLKKLHDSLTVVRGMREELPAAVNGRCIFSLYPTSPVTLP